MELSLVPQMPIMYDQAELMFPDEARKASDLCSNIYSFTFSIGQFFGPIYGGYLTNYIGYRSCCDTVAVMLILYSIVFFVLARNTKSMSSDMEYISKESKEEFKQ